jgi:hypothetical protein
MKEKHGVTAGTSPGVLLRMNLIRNPQSRVINRALRKKRLQNVVVLVLESGFENVDGG